MRSSGIEPLEREPCWNSAELVPADSYVSRKTTPFLHPFRSVLAGWRVFRTGRIAVWEEGLRRGADQPNDQQLFNGTARPVCREELMTDASRPICPSADY